MPEDNQYKYVVQSTSTTVSANLGDSTTNNNWTINDLDLERMLNDNDLSVKKVKNKMKKKKEENKELLFNCDWCDKSFMATVEEVNHDKNHGYYCSLKCKIQGKYGRSSLNKDLFELEEEKEGDNAVAE